MVIFSGLLILSDIWIITFALKATLPGRLIAFRLRFAFASTVVGKPTGRVL